MATGKKKRNGTKPLTGWSKLISPMRDRHHVPPNMIPWEKTHHHLGNILPRTNNLDLMKSQINRRWRKVLFAWKSAASSHCSLDKIQIPWAGWQNISWFVIHNSYNKYTSSLEIYKIYKLNRFLALNHQFNACLRKYYRAIEAIIKSQFF